MQQKSSQEQFDEPPQKQIIVMHSQEGGAPLHYKFETRTATKKSLESVQFLCIFRTHRISNTLRTSTAISTGDPAQKLIHLKSNVTKCNRIHISETT